MVMVMALRTYFLERRLPLSTMDITTKEIHVLFSLLYTTAVEP
jgi:hypothetical protein